MISNPILQGLTVVQGVDLTLATTDPTNAPTEAKKFWFNYVGRNLFLAIATNSLTDWIALGGSPEWVDIENKPATFPSTWANVDSKPATFPSTWANVDSKPDTFPSTWDLVANKPDLAPNVETILNKIVVADGQVLTTEDNVIFED
jgi:hypothetical protein